MLIIYRALLQFQSTLPVKGATIKKCAYIIPTVISIHAPCEGSDQPAFFVTACNENFNPRSL